MRRRADGSWYFWRSEVERGVKDEPTVSVAGEITVCKSCFREGRDNSDRMDEVKRWRYYPSEDTPCAECGLMVPSPETLNQLRRADALESQLYNYREELDGINDVIVTDPCYVSKQIADGVTQRGALETKIADIESRQRIVGAKLDEAQSRSIVYSWR